MNYPIKVTTDYSLLKSLINIDDLIKTLKEKNITCCGICDNNLLGSNIFYKSCIENDIKPLIGLEIKIDNNPLYLYAKNYDGYKKLLEFSSILNDRDITVFDIEKNSNNLIIIVPYKSRMIAKNFKKYDMYISYDTNEEKESIINAQYKSLYVIDIKSINKEDSKYINYLDLIDKGKTIDDVSNNRYYSLEDLNNEVDDFLNEFVNKIDIKFPEKPNHLPVYNCDDSKSLFKSLVLKGLNKRLHNEVSNKYKTRLEYEISVIEKMGFIDYFLIVYDYVLYAKKNNIAVGPGRGSAAGSLVSYCLGITDIDPLKYNLLFERFLNPERVTMPDIDVDFEDEYRYKVIDYVKEKYGHDHVGLIVTYGTFLSKQALRDISRILKISDEEISPLMKYIDSDKNLIENYTEDVKKILDNNSNLKTCYKIASKIYGLKRHTSTHAAGVVISKETLETIVPVIKTNDELIVGLTMNELEENGLLKMDFLGLKNIGTIKKIVENINDSGINLDLKNIPLNDSKTFELLKSGNTKGIFQFETSGMMNLLPKLLPNSFNDLVAALALFRPGPMDNIDLYIKNKKHPELIKYPDMSLKDILEETYGIIVYQEQIMQILQTMAGYSFAEADNIRRAMSKKKEEIILREKDNFINRSIKKGYSKIVANNVYDLILKFANYGFNKAHSVSYALIGYEMAYLKANYPNIFITTNLDIFGSAQVKCKEYLNEALKYNLKIYKPILNKSTNKYINKGINILLPFNIINGISEEFSLKIIEERNKGEYKDIFDFVRRIPINFINKNNLTKLIYADVFKDFGYNQKTLINNLEEILNYASLANGLDDNQIKKPYLIIDKEYKDNELRLNELNAYGFYISNHPSSSYQTNVIKVDKINSYFDKKVNMVLVIENIRMFKTKKNEDMASILASDETGSIEVVVFPRNYELINNLSDGDIVLVTGNVGKRFADYQVIANNIKKKN